MVSCGCENTEHNMEVRVLDNKTLAVEDKVRDIFSYIGRTLTWLKIAEESIECFEGVWHLGLSKISKKFFTTEFNKTLQDIHDGGHVLEGFLHSFCILNDFYRFGRWISKTYDREKSIITNVQNIIYDFKSNLPNNCLRIADKVAHAVTHLIGTLHFCVSQNFFRLGPIEKVFPYVSWIRTAAFGLSITRLFIATIANHLKVIEENKGKNSDFLKNFKFAYFGINVGGFISSLILSLKELELPFVIRKLAVLAATVHSICAVYLLSRLQFKIKVTIEKDELTDAKIGHLH